MHAGTLIRCMRERSSDVSRRRSSDVSRRRSSDVTGTLIRCNGNAHPMCLRTLIRCVSGRSSDAQGTLIRCPGTPSPLYAQGHLLRCMPRVSSLLYARVPSCCMPRDTSSLLYAQGHFLPAVYRLPALPWVYPPSRCTAGTNTCIGAPLRDTALGSRRENSLGESSLRRVSSSFFSAGRETLRRLSPH